MGIGKRLNGLGNGGSVGDEGVNKVSKEQREMKNSEINFIPEEPKYQLEDLIVPESVREQLLDLTEYTANSQIVFEQWGLNKTHRQAKRIGINLYGPPGTGKTMAAHAIAQHLNRKILVVNYADIESKYVGETPKNIRRVFEAAKSSNSIIFFDEADAILSKRVTGMTSATDVSVNQTRSVMLMLLNDYQDFVLFATNFIENFDPAFMRRISSHIRFDLPDYDCRVKLWKKYIPFQMPNDIDVEYMARTFAGVSGSDISNAVLNAAFKAARAKECCVSQNYIENAVNNILESKNANAGISAVTTTREVSKEYAEEQLNKLK